MPPAATITATGSDSTNASASARLATGGSGAVTAAVAGTTGMRLQQGTELMCHMLAMQ